MKKIEDYLHLYLGCECLNSYNQIHTLTVDNFKTLSVWGKPILRSVNDMTINEAIDIFSTLDIGISGAFTPTQFKKLLSKHFDLFGLLESGFAIDAKTLKKYNAIDLT